MDEDELTRWFGKYLDAFAACARGESDARALLSYWGVPLLVATDDGFFALTTADQVAAAAQQQIDQLQAAGYDRSELVGSDVTSLNATSSLYRGEFSWLRADGDEIGRPTVTYLSTEGSDGPRISVLAASTKP